MVVVGVGIARLAVVLVVAGSLVGTAQARAQGHRIPRDLFGLNFQAIDRVPEAARKQHLAQIRRLGIRELRVNLSWAVIEPLAPGPGGRRYDFGRYDAIVGAAARGRVRLQPTIVQTPRWNTYNDLQLGGSCNGAASVSPLSLAHYADLARAVAERYGRRGAFWAQHPELPPRPFKRYEIWNEPNFAGGWCPRPQPARYAQMLVAAADRIRAFDPRAEIMVGGLAEPALPSPRYLRVRDFLAQAIAAEPRFRPLADSVAVHMFPEPRRRKVLGLLRRFRRFLGEGGVSRRTPIVINEIGWPTAGTPAPVREGRRKRALRALSVALPRSDCNVGGLLPHTWITPQANPASSQDWFGLADPLSGRPYRSARAFARGVREVAGRRRYERLRVCRRR